MDCAGCRNKKPLVAGKITVAQLKPAILIALFFALLLSLLSPLGIVGTMVHALGLLSATFYNFKLKKTLLSVLPYVISFGSLPWAIYLSAGKHPPLWLVLGFILISSAFHFLNVLKDLEMDVSQGVLGLPQRVGKKASILIATFLVVAWLLFLQL
jgi:4-hydroxybenzoate polyprenyltransferase